MQQAIEGFTPDSKSEFPEWADMGFLYRELGDKLQDAKASANAWESKISEILGLGVTATALADPTAEDADKVSGKLCNAFVKIEIQPKFGKRDSPEHKAMCHHFGISPENAHLFSPHFVAVTEKLTADAEKGLPTLPGIIGQYKKFGMKYVRKKQQDV